MELTPDVSSNHEKHICCDTKVISVFTTFIHYLFHILHAYTDYKLLRYAMNIKKDKYKIILL